MSYGLTGKPGYDCARPFYYLNFEFTSHRNIHNPFGNMIIWGLFIVIHRSHLWPSCPWALIPRYVRDEHDPDRAASHQTAGTVSLVYSLLGDTQFGAVEWRALTIAELSGWTGLDRRMKHRKRNMLNKALTQKEGHAQFTLPTGKPAGLFPEDKEFRKKSILTTLLLGSHTRGETTLCQQTRRSSLSPTERHLAERIATALLCYILVSHPLPCI